MANATFSIRIDPDMKRQFDRFCADVGMNPSTAFNMFVRVVVRDKKLPFEVSSLRLTEQDLSERAADFKAGRNIVTHDIIEA
ncbi:MAG: type II toxin-antitoxin system RelB/DinJ family antitoxin [Clostridiales Family XIII bacterium]|jgi:DNA-damage-inducible protein J|nr:type II toxin-antitoxin system RelB/DinJ family antitoxin [Clostridiales Family XIII bacterium]